MNREEKEAIERIQKRIKDNEDYLTNQVWLTEDVRCARVVLNLIQKHEKIIDKMAEKLEEKSKSMTKGKWKEYFKKEVEKE